MPLRRFRLILDAASPFGTEPTSGTLFGQFCWAKRAFDGRDALRAWLARLPAEPFLISDLLPADHLPRPLLPLVSPDGDAPAGRPTPAAAIRAADAAKALKKRRFIALDAWRRLRTGATGQELNRLLAEGTRDDVPPRDPPFLRRERCPHNRIDRWTGRTPQAGGGGLWFADELWPEQQRESLNRIEADLYVETPLQAREVERLIAHVGADGFGRDAAFGRGRFRVEGWEEMAWLAEMPAASGGRRMLSLSQGVITPNMTEARWRRFVLFGKVGREMMAAGRRPWKLPLVLAAAGATFVPADIGPFGAWVTGVHQDDDPADPIGHNAFHLVVPYTESQ
jgi:CRISPR-associated protein Csm4